MDASRWKVLRDTFDELVETPRPLRERRLAELAESDPVLHQEVAAMLAADVDADRNPLPPRHTGNTSDPAVGQTLGRYEIRQLLGRGGFGAVYRAFDPQLRREVALKTIVPTDVDLRRRFRREAEIAASLVHPRIVTIHDFGEFSQGEPFLVQELLPGEDLDELLERRLPATLGERLTILEDVLEGLAYAHRLGVVHRDVKPGNVRVLPDGHAKLLDFGIARVVGGAGVEASALTQTGAALGTLAYLPPEVLRGETAGPAADVWGAGVVAFELLSFERPFRSTTPAALVYDIAHGETPRLPAGLPAPLAAWVGRAMDRDPQRRFADASIAREALQEAMRGLAGPGRTGSNSRRMVGPQRNRRRVPIFAGAIAAAAFIAVLAWFASTRSSGREDQTATGSLPAAPVAVSDPSGPSESPTPESVPTSVADVVPNVWARFDARLGGR